MRIAIVDHSLKDMEGHHFEYSDAVARAIRDSGNDPVILASRDFTTEAPEFPVVPWFTEGFYYTEADKSLRSIAYRSLPLLPPIMRQAAYHGAQRIQSLRRRLQRKHASGRFGVELVEAIRHQGLTASDHVLIHTLNLSNLRGLAAALAAAPDIAWPSLHIVLRRTPAEMANGSSIARGPQASLARIAAAGLWPRPLRFYSDTEQLCASYDALSPIRFACLPIPFRQDYLDAALARHVTREAPLTLTYLGNARLEKGYQHLPDLVSATEREPALSGQVRFIIQSSFNIAGGEPGVAAAFRRLERYPESRVRLIRQTLSPQNYYQVLAESDIVLLPYAARLYQTRSSGILAQALAAGRPALVPAETWMAQQVDGDRGRAFSNSSDLPRAVIDMVKNYPALRRATESAAPAWRECHDPGRLVSILLDESDPR